MKKFAALLTLLCLMLPGCGERGVAIREQQSLIKQHIYADYKEMYRQPSGDALIYPYITPGSKSYSNVLWDWDSWLSDVALRQILSDVGTEADCEEALV